MRFRLFILVVFFFLFFFFNDTATTEIYTLSLHDALPILHRAARANDVGLMILWVNACFHSSKMSAECNRSEEHTSELQSRSDLVCRLLLEKKKNTAKSIIRLIQITCSWQRAH